MTSPTTDRRFGLVGNQAIKAPVTVLADSNITQSGQQTIDGIAVLAVNAAGVPDRVVCTGMTDQTKNGIWDVSATAWIRSPDADGTYDLEQGSIVLVNSGAVYNGALLRLKTSNPVVIGTSLLTWDIAGGGSSGSGTVSNVSIVAANGFTGAVANPTTTPAITLGTTVSGILFGNGASISAAIGADLPPMTAIAGGAVPTPPNDVSKVLSGIGTWIAGGGTGTVTTASIVTTNGFAGTVANPTTTPAITIKTSVTGILLGNGTSVSAAVGNDLPVMTATTRGAVPTPPNNANVWLNGAGTYTAPGGSGTVTSVSVVSANGMAGTVATATTTPAITLSTSITGMLKGNGTAISAASAGVDYVSPSGGDARYVILEAGGGIQNCGDSTRIALSDTGTWTNSLVSYIMDANIKSYSDFTSPADGYLRAAVSGESRIDFNGVGGAPIGGYFTAIGHGSIGGSSVSDAVGMLAQAYKFTNNWQAGVHVDLFDHFNGGTSIGYNLEVPNTQAGSTTIGFNMQPFPGMTMNYGINFQGDQTGTTYGAFINCVASAGSVIDLSGSGNTPNFIKFADTNTMWSSLAVGAYVGKLTIVKGGSTFYIPFYS